MDQMLYGHGKQDVPAPRDPDVVGHVRLRKNGVLDAVITTYDSPAGRVNSTFRGTYQLQDPHKTKPWSVATITYSKVKGMATGPVKKRVLVFYAENWNYAVFDSLDEAIAQVMDSAERKQQAVQQVEAGALERFPWAAEPQERPNLRQWSHYHVWREQDGNRLLF